MIDLDHALMTATASAHKAGERIKQGFTDPMNFTSKGDIADRVTQTDFDAQTIIQEMLAKEFPDIDFLGEEDVTSDKPTNDKRRSCWIVDPLDGTMNFTHRLPFCGVSIGLQMDREMVLGVLYFPSFNWMYTAIKGKGAKKNGEKIHVTECARFEDATITEIYSDREARGKKVLYPPVATFRKFGSAITSFAFLSEGMIDGTAVRCRIWDMAAAEVIIREAGGTVTVWKDDEKDPRTSLTCIASTPKIHEKLCSFTKKALGS